MIMERSEINGDQKMEEIILPGFRFHPTDEELVGFYLKRKVQERPVSIELIKPLDIYKHDPWDLPKLATTGEKEWYFYCRRDRKYQNSARPNRVTGGGFWKATGTDRPIYSSDGAKCIGLKKSLVFYKGRAAKGFKTDWMMHEFRLPSTATVHHKGPSNRGLVKSFPPHELWAICRIFKKPSSNAQRGISHSWVSPILPKHPSPVLPQYGKDYDHFDHKLFNIDTTFPTLTTTNNNKATPTFISSNQEPDHLISVLEPNYNFTIDTSSVFNVSPSITGDFDEDLDYMTNEKQDYFNDRCFSLDSVPMMMQDQDQEHISKVMLTSPTDIVYFDNHWDFLDTNNVL